MKILLIQPPHYYNGKSRVPAFVPLGIGYIAKVLSNSGHNVEVLDIWVHQWTSEEVLKRIQKLDYDIVGISAISTQYAYVKWLVAEIKKHNSTKIIVGGALATFNPEIVLKNTQTDICVIGEGEITIKELCENIDNLSTVKGIYFKKNEEIIKNLSREYIKNLDSIESPVYDLFSMDIYLKYCRVFGHLDIKALNIVTGRGCPYKCRFCSKTFYKGLRYRTVNNIIHEIKILVEKYDIRGISINDETFVFNKERVYEFCKKIEPLNIKWNCQGRANLVDLELLKCMKKAGCVAVGYGVESGSQRILNNMNKKITVEQSETAIKNTIKAGMLPIVQMMYGYPGETRETLQETVRFFKKLPYLGYKGISIAIDFTPTTPLPGSELYDQTLKDGLIENEEEYLYSLEGGYMSERKRLLVNFTEFGNEEFYQFMQKTKREIFKNHIKNYPFRFTMDYLLTNFKTLLLYLTEYGYKETINMIIKKLGSIFRCFF